MLGAEGYTWTLCYHWGRGRDLSLSANHRHRAAKIRRDKDAEKAPLLRPRYIQGLPKKEAGPRPQRHPFSDSTAATAESRGWLSNTEQNPGPTLQAQATTTGECQTSSVLKTKPKPSSSPNQNEPTPHHQRCAHL